MKHSYKEKSISAAWAFGVSCAVSAATTFCLVTAFHLQIDTGLLLCTCVLASLVSSVCYSLPLGLVPLGVGAAILGNLWQKGILETSAEAFLNRLSRQYDQAYGWGIVRWSYRTADEMEPDIVFILCILGAIIAMITAWSICRGKTVFPSLISIFLPFACCFVVNDTVPDTTWLYLLLLGCALLVMTSHVRKQDAKQGNRLSLYLTPLLALGLLCLFFVFPRDSYDGQETAEHLSEAVLNSDPMQLFLGHMNESAAIGGSVNTNEVNLKSVGYRLETHAQVLQVTAPYTGDIYLRGKAMDTFDGVSWQQSDIDYDTLYWPSNQLQVAGEISITTRFAHRMLYMPYYADLSDTQDVSTGIMNEKNLTEYSFTCRKAADPSSWVSGQVSDSLEKYIPADKKIMAWAKPVAKKLIASQNTTYQTALAIASYVRNSAAYNTRTARMPAGKQNFAQWFLEESNTGYCVHFATAATVLLQAAGIPARYVTGYYTQVTEGEPVTVYSDQAHAWAEFWLPGYGWTVLEATPPDFSAEPEETTQNATTGAQPTQSNDPVSAPSTPAPTEPAQQETPETNKDPMIWVLSGFALLCAIIAVAQGQRSIRRHLRQKKLDAAATPNEKALLYWQETVLFAQLLQETPDKSLYALAEMARFSHHTLTESQLRQFESYAETAISRLREHNLLRRIYYRLFLALY